MFSNFCNCDIKNEVIDMVERFTGKKILIVGVGKTGFKLINFFNTLDCDIKVTDIKPIFDLNKAVKKLKRLTLYLK